MADEVKYGFVVLHYMAFETTLKCTASLLALEAPLHVVIVDNASPDRSGARLQEYFAQTENVTVLLNQRNEGFARGNNAGYSYLREHFSCAFISVLNNDVLIPDPQFPQKVEAIYRETPFAVLGPDILNPTSGKHQNPAHLKGFTREEVQERLERYQRNLHHFHWNRFKWKLKRLLRPAPASQENAPWQNEAQNVVLHGACYVFSKDFIGPREQCFHPGTFLYFEEEILHWECMRDGLITLYSPSVQVLHLEDVSTDLAFRSSARKDKLKLQESVRSMQVFLNLMNS